MARRVALVTPREQFEATFSALTEEQRREVRLLARPFEWTQLEVVGQDVWGRCCGIGTNNIVVCGTEDGPYLSAYCTKCGINNCIHGLALQTLYYGGHPMKTITGRQGDDR